LSHLGASGPIDYHPRLAAQAAARKLARSGASTSEHGAEQQVWGWWARAQARDAPSTRPVGGIKNSHGGMGGDDF